MPRRNRTPRVTLRQIKANANSAATKADLFMDWLLAQAEDIDDLLDEPEELGQYLRVVFKGFITPEEGDVEPDTEGKKSLVSKLWTFAGSLFAK